MKSPLLCLTCSALMLLCWWGMPGIQNVTAVAEQPPIIEQYDSGIVTMYALDPLARVLCLHDGRAGLMIRDHRVAKRCSDLSFSADGGRLVTGIEANRVGAIIDIGTAEELRTRYGQEEVGFASVRLHGDKVAALILKEDRPQERVELLKEGQTLFSSLGPSASAPILLGHLYLLRIADIKDATSQLTVKLLVIAYTPNESVTLRWQRL